MSNNETTLLDKYDDDSLYLTIEPGSEGAIKTYSDPSEVLDEADINLDELNTYVSSSTISEDDSYKPLTEVAATW